MVRRHQVVLDPHHRREARRRLRGLAGARNRLAGVDAQLAQLQARTVGGRPGVKATQLEGKRQAAARLVAERQAEVADWAHLIGFHRELEGWIPQGKDAKGNYVDLPACPATSTSTSTSTASHRHLQAPPVPLAGVGRWAKVSEMPASIEELVYPLHPLIPDPSQPDADGAKACVYFGLVPTGSSEVDSIGTARLDEVTQYEIRCFVRRHKPACPRSGPQCHCPVTWSDPTEAYQLAGHFDLQGTSNRPVTVQLPNLHQLQSDALTLPPGSTGGLQTKAPQSLMPSGSSFPPSGGMGGAEICSFAIPLITIVATFVLKLFLPIVILAFQLWFMLLLKFCIPPELGLDAGLSAALSAVPPDVDVSASFAASFDATWGATIDAGVDSMFGGMDDSGGDAPSVSFDASAGDLDRLRLAKLLLSGPIDPVPPTDLVFAPRVRRDQAQA